MGVHEVSPLHRPVAVSQIWPAAQSAPQARLPPQPLPMVPQLVNAVPLLHEVTGVQELSPLHRPVTVSQILPVPQLVLHVMLPPQPSPTVPQ